MLRAVKRKLNDRKGASLMVGLLFFVTCAVVGSVILAAAASSMGRISGLAMTDQNRYAAQSAAKVVKDQIGKAEYSSVNVIGTPFNGSDKNNTTYTPQNLTDIVEVMADKNLQQYWEDGNGEHTTGTIEDLWQSATEDETGADASGNIAYNSTNVILTQKQGTVYEYNDINKLAENLAFTVKDGNEDAAGIGKVNVEITMDSSFGVDIVISNAGSNSDSGSNIELHAEPYIGMTFDSFKDSDGSEQKQITTSISWTVNEGNASASSEAS